MSVDIWSSDVERVMVHGWYAGIWRTETLGTSWYTARLATPLPGGEWTFDPAALESDPLLSHAAALRWIRRHSRRDRD